MYMADRNVFGVDLNPMAIELAEVCLWLNAIYGEPTRATASRPSRPRALVRLPALRRQQPDRRTARGVSAASLLKKGSKPAWYDASAAPARSASAHRASADEIYHFLLPDPGMANYTDKVAKQLYPEDFERLKAWRKAFNKPLESHEIERLQQLSDAIDAALGRTHPAPGATTAPAPKIRWPSGPPAPTCRHALHVARPEGSHPHQGPAQRGRRPGHALPPPQAGDGLLVRPVVLAHHPERQLCPAASSGGWRSAPSSKAISSIWHRSTSSTSPPAPSRPAVAARSAADPVRRGAAHAALAAQPTSPTCTTGSASCASAAARAFSAREDGRGHRHASVASCTGNCALPISLPSAVALIWCWGIRPGSRWSGTRPASWASQPAVRHPQVQRH